MQTAELELRTLTTCTELTRSHDDNRRWAVLRNGRPARMNCPTVGSMVSSLRIHFEGRGDDSMVDFLTWEEFFREFEAQQLAFYYQETTISGAPSRFHRFVGRPAES